MGLGTRGLGDFGTWDSGTRGRGDVGTWGRGDVGTRGRGTRERRGRRDLGRGTRGRGTRKRWDSGTRDSKTLGLGDVGPTGLEDVINKQHLIFSLNLLITIFGALEKGINYAGLPASVVRPDMFACLCYRESPDRYIIV